MKSHRRMLITDDEAIPVAGQPEVPCSDCPWRRDSLRGWLGDASVKEWIAAAHGEERIDCHVLVGPQCAGAAIYRSNVCKRPRDKSLLLLDRSDAIFALPQEFEAHHSE